MLAEMNTWYMRAQPCLPDIHCDTSGWLLQPHLVGQVVNMEWAINGDRLRGIVGDVAGCQPSLPCLLPVYRSPFCQQANSRRDMDRLAVANHRRPCIGHLAGPRRESEKARSAEYELNEFELPYLAKQRLSLKAT